MLREEREGLPEWSPFLLHASTMMQVPHRARHLQTENCEHMNQNPQPSDSQAGFPVIFL